MTVKQMINTVGANVHWILCEGAGKVEEGTGANYTGPRNNWPVDFVSVTGDKDILIYCKYDHKAAEKIQAMAERIFNRQAWWDTYDFTVDDVINAIYEFPEVVIDNLLEELDEAGL